MFDPNKDRETCEDYLSKYLGYQVKLLQATQLEKGTRTAPWKLEVEATGIVESYVLQLDQNSLEYEYQVLKAMEPISLLTPSVYGLDLSGKELGVPCFFGDFIAGESLLEPMLSGEQWAEDLYLETVCELQAITAEELGEFAQKLRRETTADVLDNAYDYLKDQSLPVAETAYVKLQTTMPKFPAVRFSNGDLWLENFIVKDPQVAGVIDFANATFSDPIFEFLLTFFVEPKLQERGIEERYCRQLGYDPGILHWYHGLEYFDTWHWVLKTGESFVHHTAESLGKDLQNWLDNE